MNWLSRNTRGNHLLDTVNQNLNGNKEYSAEGQNTSQAGHVSSGWRTVGSSRERKKNAQALLCE